MKINWFQKLLVLSISLVVFRNCCFFNYELAGRYVSNAKEPIGEIPGFGCELILMEKSKYESDCMGNGKYEIIGGDIRLSNKNQYWTFPLQRKYNVGEPMLLLFDDLNYYMIKK